MQEQIRYKKRNYSYKHADENIFTAIVDLKKQINDLQYDPKNVYMGKITHKNEKNGRIRVINYEIKNNAASYWLIPTSLMLQLFPQLKVGDFVLYSFPTSDKKQGIYFSIIDPEIILDIEQPSLEGFATESWVNANFYNKTEIDNNHYTETEIDETFETINNVTALKTLLLTDLVRRYKHNNFVQGSKGNAVTISNQWFNTQVTLTCTGSELPTSGTPVQDALPAIQLNLTSGVNSDAVIGTRIYFKIRTTARINIAAQNSVVLAGVTNGVFLLETQSQWYIEKTGALAWSLDSIAYNHLPYA